MEDLRALIDQADHAGLLIAVDRLAAAGDWDGLQSLSDRCRAAVEMGRQLWGVAQHIEYRLALEAPPGHAAAVLRPGAARFALGPLPEVAATTHTWAAMAPRIDEPVSRAAFAQERVVQGEDLRSAAVGSHLGASPPLALTNWEPRYTLPRYRDRTAAFPQPEVATRHIAVGTRTEPVTALPPDDAVHAMTAVVETWIAESSGRVRAVAVEGSAHQAISALAPSSAFGIAPITGAEALSLLQWAGASGGAYGHRRGGAAGRFAAWWAAAALAGLDWPAGMPAGVDEDFTADLGEAIDELEWFRWVGTAGDTGWTLRLAVEDPVDGLAWSIDATDQRDDGVSDPSTAPGAFPGTP